MLKLFKILVVPFLVVFLCAGNAMAIYIADNYIGFDDHGYGDVIGADNFEVSGMSVEILNGYLDINIYTNFKSGESAAYGETYGDLFISTDGWQPFGSIANGYIDDNYRTGETWEFVFDTSEENLYALPDYTPSDITNYIQLSNSGGGYIRRDDQEVLYVGGGASIFGDESSVDLTNAGNYLSYHISLGSLGLIDGSAIGLKWGTTCANDTIEGAAPVPEPATMLLLGTGLIGLAGVTRRKIYKK